MPEVEGDLKEIQALRDTVTVGIDDMAVYVPKLFISTTGEFAASRGIEPAKLMKGIGVEKMSIPDAHEDAATMAASAVLELMKRSDIMPKDIGKIYMGTESAVDEAKAMGTYVIGMLEKVYGRGSFEECSTVEFKSACIGASYALESIAEWVGSGARSGSASASGVAGGQGDDRIGIVVASDVARYELESSGEYTQGAGSVAMLVKKEPRLVALDGAIGSFTRDENDFFRPLGKRVAVVNGKHSNNCYLSAVDGAFASFKRRAQKSGMLILNNLNVSQGESILDRFSYILFHIPYPRMTEYAALSLFRQEWKDLPRWKDVTAEIGPEPSQEMFSSPEDYGKADAAYNKKFSKSKAFKETFKSKVGPTTSLSRQVGNIYTGSMYLGLASLAEQGLLHAGDKACFCSYGSGCSALVFSGTIQEGFKSLKPGNIQKKLDARKELSLKDYEDLHEGRKSGSILPPSGEFALIGIDSQGYRLYDYVS